MSLIAPFFTFGSSKPIDLANRLLDEIEAGLVPVWPSTEHYADWIVEGLDVLRETRGITVLKAVLGAPENTVLDWPSRLSRLSA